jgi:hypothetical protein
MQRVQYGRVLDKLARRRSVGRRGGVSEESTHAAGGGSSGRRGPLCLLLPPLENEWMVRLDLLKFGCEAVRGVLFICVSRRSSRAPRALADKIRQILVEYLRRFRR